MFSQVAVDTNLDLGLLEGFVVLEAGSQTDHAVAAGVLAKHPPA